MELKEVNLLIIIRHNVKLSGRVGQFENLIKELKTRELPESAIGVINESIDKLNAVETSESELKKQLRKSQADILTYLEKHLKIVAQCHYRNTWLAVGMGAFGVPFGVMFGMLLENMAFLGVGLPIGMSLGIAIGANMDKKAKEEGRQLKWYAEHI